MKSIMAGPDGSAMPGQEIAVDNVTGISLVNGGYADLVSRDPVGAETAMIEPMETTDANPVKAKARSKK